MTADEPIASISAFEILTKLSSGGMGDVLLARRHGAHGFEKLLAVKTIRGDLARRPDIRAMFLDEARLVARLDHPAIAHVYDFGEEAGTLYLAMEYVAGIALNKLLVKRQAALPPVVAMRIAAEVCRGIHAAHELTDLEGKNLGVVHRDLSPGNLILTFDGHMKILDFGIAFMHERESPDTQVGELKGKPSYMAPEQLRAERVDRRSDLYSLSVVLHEMLTGRKLFTKNNVVATVLAVERGDVPKPSELNHEVPKILDETVMKGLAKVPADRYQNAREMAAALDRMVAQLGGDASLERFVDQELVDEQRAHRTWMNAVLSGDFEEPGTYERFVANPDLLSGAGKERSITKNESPSPSAPPPADLAKEVRPLVDSTTLVPPQPTADVVALKQSPGRRLAPLVGVFVALLFGAIAYWSTSQEAIPAIQPEPLVHAEPLAPPPPEPAEPVIDETEPATPILQPDPEPEPEPKPKKVRSKKKKRKKVEAEEAASPAGPAAFGFLTIGASPYALVRIDGKEIGATPIWNRKLPAGRHEVQLVAPDTGEVRLTKIVKLEEGQQERITLE
jgi:serine/threonine protein kinase